MNSLCGPGVSMKILNSLFRRALHWKRPQRRSPTSIDESGAADARGSGERCAVLQAACHELRQRNCCRGRHELSQRQTIDLFLRVLTRPPTEESVHARGRASNSGRKSEQQRRRWRHRKQRKQRKQHPWQQPMQPKREHQQKMTYALQPRTKRSRCSVLEVERMYCVWLIIGSGVSAAAVTAESSGAYRGSGPVRTPPQGPPPAPDLSFSRRSSGAPEETPPRAVDFPGAFSALA